MSDITKSIKEIFEERISSPFYGSLIISWLLWNWEIPYVTFIVDQDKLGTVQKIINGIMTDVIITNKIDYIMLKCSNIHFLVTLPLISTAFILLLMPYITNGAYWITLKFDKWRVNKKNEVENTKLLSVEDSLRLRNQMFSQEEKYSEIIISKDEEIETLKGQLKLAVKENVPIPEKSVSEELLSDFKFDSEIDDFVTKIEVGKYYEKIYNYVKRSFIFPPDVPESVKKFCLAYQLIITNEKGYQVSERGEAFLVKLLKYQLKQLE